MNTKNQFKPPEKKETPVYTFKIPVKLRPNNLTMIEVKRKAHDYIKQCITDSKYPSKVGLCLFFGFSGTKQAWDFWDNLQKKKASAVEGWHYAQSLVEEILHNIAVNPDVKNWKGAVDMLRCTYHYTDKRELTLSNGSVMIYLPKKTEEGQPINPVKKVSINTKQNTTDSGSKKEKENKES
jgi:hypothetical protein